jgi:GNAT superfamily N-acetyltransferase
MTALRDAGPHKAATLTWRLRVALDDRPGTLARVAVRLAHLDCNVLAVSVLPVPKGVVDDLVIATPPDVLPADLISLVRAEGGRCIGITATDLTELVDTTTDALRAAANALATPGSVLEALRAVLDADTVTAIDTEADVGTGAIDIESDVGTAAIDAANAADAASPDRIAADVGDPTGHRVRLILNTQEVLVQRGWAPFTDVELARARGLAEILTAARTMAQTPTAILTSDGAGVVLRMGRPSDADLVAQMHARCSLHTLFARYHAGVRSVPKRWLNRLLNPPRGNTVLAMCGYDVIGMAQLISTGNPHTAEISLLVEDAWQRKGIGTALLSRTACAARAGGVTSLVAWCLPSESNVLRTAASAGLATATRTEMGLLRVTVDTTPPQLPHESVQYVLP